MMQQECTSIDHNLYVGPRPENHSDIEYLAGLGIQYIVDLTSGVGDDYNDDVNYIRNRMIEYINIPIIDAMAPDQYAQHILESEVFPKILAGFNTYVHCRCGKGRSPTVVIYHYMNGGSTLKEALEFVQNKHLLTEITDEQMRFLMALDQLQSEEDKEDLFEEYKQEKEYLNE